MFTRTARLRRLIPCHLYARLEVLEDRRLLSTSDIGDAWQPIEPHSSLAFQQVIQSSLNAEQPEERFQFDLLGGQTFAALARSEGTVPEFRMEASDGQVLGSSVAGVDGTAHLATLRTNEPGRYDLVIVSPKGATTEFDLTLWVNATIEAERATGADNNIPQRAEILDAQFYSLDDSSLATATVEGHVSLVDEAVWSDDFESDALSPLWSSRTLGGGRVQLGENGRLQTRVLHLDSIVESGVAEAILDVDLSQTNSPFLQFRFRDLDNNDTTGFLDHLPRQFDGATFGDGMSVTIDGETWYRLETRGQPIDLKTALASQNLDPSAISQLKFHYLGDRTYPRGGIELDDLVLADASDWYTFQAQPGTTINAGLAYELFDRRTYPPRARLELYDAQQQLLAVSVKTHLGVELHHQLTGAPDQVSPYFLKVSGNAGDYQLTVGRGVDSMPAANLPEAVAPLTHTGRFVGTIGASSSRKPDYQITRGYTISPGLHEQTGFGTSVSQLGDELVVGDPADPRSGQSGQVEVLRFDGFDWRTESVIAAPSSDESYFGRNVYVHEDWLFVASTSFAKTTAVESRVHVYQRQGDVWVPTQRLTGPPGIGQVIELNNGTLFLGAPDGEGAVAIYRHADGQWQLQQTLALAPDEIGHGFGYSLSVSDNVLAVGIPGKRHGTNQGAVAIYERSDAGWVRTTQLHEPDLNVAPLYGRAVALDGDTLAVGAPRAGLTMTDNFGGQVFVYERVGVEWQRQQILEFERYPEARTFEYLGGQIELAGNRMVVGAVRAGHGVVYTRVDDQWVIETQLDYGPGNSGTFPQSIVMDENRIVVGMGNQVGIFEQPSNYNSIRVKPNDTLRLQVGAVDGVLRERLDLTAALFSAEGTLLATAQSNPNDGSQVVQYHVDPNAVESQDLTLRVTSTSDPLASGAFYVDLSVESGAIALEPFEIRMRAPVRSIEQDGAFQFSTNRSLDASSLDSSDIQVNGESVAGLAFSNGRGVVFDVDLADGKHLLQIAAGAFRDALGNPVNAFTTEILVDREVPRLESATIQPGSVVDPSVGIFSFEYSEPVRLGPDRVDARYRYEGGSWRDLHTQSENTEVITLQLPRPREGAYELLIPQLRDLQGNLSPDSLVIPFEIDVQTMSIDDRFESIGPFGRTAAYRRGLLTANDVDQFSLVLSRDEVLTVYTEVDNGLTEFTIIDPLGRTVARSDGTSQYLTKSIVAAESGAYIISLRAAERSQYELTVDVDRFRELEPFTRTPNNTPADAESLTPALRPLGDDVSVAVMEGRVETGDEDWYRLDVGNARDFSVLLDPIAFTDSSLQLYDMTGTNLLASHVMTADLNRLIQFERGPNQAESEYLLRVSGPPVAYDLQVTIDAALDQSLFGEEEVRLTLESDRARIGRLEEVVTGGLFGVKTSEFMDFQNRRWIRTPVIMPFALPFELGIAMNASNVILGGAAGKPLVEVDRAGNELRELPNAVGHIYGLAFHHGQIAAATHGEIVMLNYLTGEVVRRIATDETIQITDLSYRGPVLYAASGTTVYQVGDEGHLTPWWTFEEMRPLEGFTFQHDTVVVSDLESYRVYDIASRELIRTEVSHAVLGLASVPESNSRERQYQFVAAANEQVQITIMNLGDGPSSVQLQLIDPENNVIAQNSNGIPGGNVIVIRLPSDGLYQVRIVSDDAERTDYMLQFHRVPTEGDVNQDGVVDAEDINQVAAAVRMASTDEVFDLDQDGEVAQRDYDHLIREMIGTVYGDSNLDGLFDSGDLVNAFQRGRYEDPSKAADWTSGDWNGDGVFDSQDLVWAFRQGGFQPFPAKGLRSFPA